MNVTFEIDTHFLVPTTGPLGAMTTYFKEKTTTFTVQDGCGVLDESAPSTAEVVQINFNEDGGTVGEQKDSWCARWDQQKGRWETDGCNILGLRIQNQTSAAMNATHSVATATVSCQCTSDT